MKSNFKESQTHKYLHNFVALNPLTEEQLKTYPALESALKGANITTWNDYDDSGTDTPWNDWAEHID